MKTIPATPYLQSNCIWDYTDNEPALG